MKAFYISIVSTVISTLAFAQKPIYYEVSFPNAAHHEARIVMTIPEAPNGTVRVRMSRSSAGRYATHEFGKNIYNVKAFNVDSTALNIKQVEGDVYEIADHGPTIKVSYILYANWVDGTYAGVDESHAHLNMPAAFMWVPGLEKRAVKFEFDDIDKYDWKVATQLKHEGGNVYSAPSLQYMMDSPTELSAFKAASWEVVNPDGKKQTIRLSSHSVDDQGVIDNFAKMVQKVVHEEKAVYGEFPAYDFGEYTFLHDVYPTNGGDGMEHRNSTIITQPSEKIAGNEARMLGTFSHEYFHSWNVKRIRPKSLEPFNFEHANMSSELWFAEGFTQYYGELVLVRAGFRTLDAYTITLAGLVNSVLNTPGATKYSPVQMSNYSVFADAGVSIDPTNRANIFTSYYTYGGAVALALDIRLRTEFSLTLDDYMHQVWLDYGKPYIPYTVPDLEKSLAKVTKNKVFAADFFKRYVNGIEKNNYEQLLAKAGLVLRKRRPGIGWAGQLTPANNGSSLVIGSNTVVGTPLYAAGLDIGDAITKIDGVAVTATTTFDAAIADKKPGTKIIINFENRSGAHQTTLTLAESPSLEVVTGEKAGLTLTPEQESFRKNWLSSKVK